MLLSIHVPSTHGFSRQRSKSNVVVQGVGLARQAAVPGQKAVEREPLGISERRLDRNQGSGRLWQPSGTSRGQPGPGRLGPRRSQR